MTKVNLFDLLASRDESRSVLGVTLRRFGFSNHVLFWRRDNESRTGDIVSRVESLISMVKETLPIELVVCSSDLIVLVETARDLNQPRAQLPWEILSPIKKDEMSTDYDGRFVISIVDSLASNYGWSIQEIFLMQPEIVLLCYQECQLRTHKRKEWEHLHSEIAWGYNSTTKKREYNEMESLPWVYSIDKVLTKESAEPIPQHIKDKYFPNGNIIDLTKSRKTNGIP